MLADKYRQLAWSKTTSTSNDNWQYANVLVGSPSAYTIVFEGQSGANLGLVAIDDVSFSPSCFVGGEWATDLMFGQMQ